MDHGRVNPEFTLDKQGFSGLGAVYYNATEPDLVAHALRRDEGELGQGGTLMVNTGKFTGRSPKDKHIVVSETTEDAIWWDANARMTPEAFENLHDDMRAHMAGKDYFVQDLFAGADLRYQIGVRIVSELAWHNLFIRHLLIQPEPEQLDEFAADFTLVNCPSFFADPERHGCRTETVIAFNFEKKLILVAGTEYAGENKKAVFTLLNYHFNFISD